MNGQIDFLNELESVNQKSNIKVVKAKYEESLDTNWENLFEGFDEIYAITYSSGINFINKVLNKFEYGEIVFGFEGVLNTEVATIMAVQLNTVEKLVNAKDAIKLSKRLENETLKFFVSRDTKSHEKIFILKNKNGKTRVITGSANMSASAFCGVQRENILCFDDIEAYNYYKNIFDDFKENCSDYVSYDTVSKLIKEKDNLKENIEDLPISKTIENKKILVLEEKNNDENMEPDIVTSVKGLEKEIKPMLPKQKREKGKIVISGDILRSFKRKFKEDIEVKKVREKQLPKLHIDYDNNNIYFNNKILNVHHTKEEIASDLACLFEYLNSLEVFYGNVEESKMDYYKFFNWYFASPFMPYLRYIASKNNYDVTPFPVVGIIYGDSNGGKSTFIKLITKLMCGKKIPMNNSSDFTYTNIENLKRAMEGIPINIDDLAKVQFTSHSEKIIKDDHWGLDDRFINYPAISITTNKLASLPQDITKRTVTSHIDIKIDKETGARNSKRINESIKKSTTALFSYYGELMLKEIEEMENNMKSQDNDYFPDIFEVSSRVLLKIIDEVMGQGPNYARLLTYKDYFGHKAVGKKAINQILNAWENEPNQFKIDKKNNKLIYYYPDQGRLYELAYLQQELPPSLNPQLLSKSIVMDLDKAKEIFGVTFKKGILKFRRY